MSCFILSLKFKMGGICENASLPPAIIYVILHFSVTRSVLASNGNQQIFDDS